MGRAWASTMGVWHGSSSGATAGGVVNAKSFDHLLGLTGISERADHRAPRSLRGIRKVGELAGARALLLQLEAGRRIPSVGPAGCRAGARRELRISRSVAGEVPGAPRHARDRAGDPV